jgi:hypothetical protein
VNQGHVFRSVGALVIVTALCVTQSPQSRPRKLERIYDPGHVTYSIHLRPGSCHTRDHRQLPETRCTPGSVDSAVTQDNIHSTICRVGWTGKVRPPEAQTERAKYHVAYPAYHIPASAGSELDHLVPLELGGSNDMTNLWPEVGRIPNPKDKVEDALNQAVCRGRVSLVAAQLAIATNWLTAEARLGLTTPRPSPSPTSSRTPKPTPSPTKTPPPASPWCTASASYNANYHDYDIYVYSNQPNQTVTATASNGASHSYHTDSSGYADVYLYANSGNNVQVKAGAASCSTTT